MGGYTLIIDNYDSFTWNVYADVANLGGNPLVKRNDKITIEEVEVSHTVRKCEGRWGKFQDGQRPPEAESMDLGQTLTYPGHVEQWRARETDHLTWPWSPLDGFRYQ
jgi:hypothetical protein